MTTEAGTLSPTPIAAGPAERLASGGGWWSLLLGLVALLAMTEALVAAAWTDGLEVVRLAVLGGALLAFALALTRWEGIFPALYSLLASLAWITTLFNQLIFTGTSAQDGVHELITRNVNWVIALINGTASADNLIFVTQLTLLGWWIGYLAIWSLIRHRRVLHAIIPAGVALLINAYYASVDVTSFLIIFLVAVLLLAIRIELARNQARWQLTQVRYAPDITLDFLKAGVGFAAVVILLAWAVPDLADKVSFERVLRPFEGPWQKVEDTWNRMYKSLNYGQAAVQRTTFGKSLNFGGPVSLTDRPIFEAETPERTYWRAAVFDTYTRQGWLNTAPDVVVVDRFQPLGEPLFSETWEMTSTIRSLETGQEVLFTPPQPVRVSVPVNADVVLMPGEEPARAVTLLRSRVSLAADRPYQVVSAITDASPDRLRGAGADYPAWVRDRYLQLPDDLPERVKDLALRITAAYDNPYDKAEALEAVLRIYTYDQKIAAPPAGADGVDYFLFDVKAGYCDYYASALAVMLRSVGVPARFVIGYTPGQLQPTQEQDADDTLPVYRVLERNAHAWTEVYFPTYGWIQFEPTASEPLLVRPAPAPEAPLDAGLTPDTSPILPEPADNRPDIPSATDTAGRRPRPALVVWLSRHWGWFAAVALLGAGAAGGWRLFRRRQQAFFSDSQLLTRLFGLLGLWAARLHIPWPASHTPAEHAAEFSASLPEAEPAVTRLAHLFAAERYGQQQPDAASLVELGESWQVLQPQFWRRWLMGELRGRARQR